MWNSPCSGNLLGWGVNRSGVEQTVKERAVALQRNPQILGRYITAAIPLLLQIRASIGEAFRQTLHDGSHQLVRFFHRPPWLVYKVSLNVAPPVPQVHNVRLRKQTDGRIFDLVRLGTDGRVFP